MNTFIMHLQGAAQYEHIDDVESFVGQDDSGSFGILAGHARAMTCLRFGLARFRRADAKWRYVALPGGVLYFAGNQLYVSTRHYVYDADYQRIQVALHDELRTQEQRVQRLKASAARLEEQLLRQLWILQREGRLRP